MTAFFISHKSDVKTFLKWILNQYRTALVNLTLYYYEREREREREREFNKKDPKFFASDVMSFFFFSFLWSLVHVMEYGLWCLALNTKHLAHLILML